MHTPAIRSNHDGICRRAPLRALALVVAGAVLLASGCSDDAAPSDARELSSDEVANVDVATRLVEAGLIGGDAAVIDDLVSSSFVQHNARTPDGRQGLVGLAMALAESGASVDVHRKLANGNLVAFHSTYDDPGFVLHEREEGATAVAPETRLVAFDVFRLERGRVAEHWDALQQWVEPEATVSGNTLVDGTQSVRDRHLTSSNAELVTRMVREVFVDGRLERLADYIGSSYIQHNPRVDNGLASSQAFFNAVKDQGVPLGYTASPLVVADGNFVLVGSEGYLGRLMDEEDASSDMPRYAYTLFYDLFRVNGGEVVEHWDVIQRVDPGSVPHANGLF